jgi:hypothetical protein
MSILQQAFSNISGGRVLDVATSNGNFVGTVIENLRPARPLQRARSAPDALVNLQTIVPGNADKVELLRTMEIPR